MFIFKKRKKSYETDSINNDYELPEKEIYTNIQNICMICCNTKLNIEHLFNKTLCPHCNTQLNYIIEPIFIPENIEIDKIIPEANTNANKNEHDSDSENDNKNKNSNIKIIFPLYILIKTIVIGSLLYRHSNV